MGISYEIEVRKRPFFTSYMYQSEYSFNKDPVINKRESLEKKLQG